MTKDRKYGEIFRFALNTGMRKGEILGLKWDAINFKEQTINIFRSYDLETKAIRDYCKGKRRRTIGMNDVVMNDILRLRMRNTETVFAEENGGVVNYWSLEWYFKKYIRECLIKPICFHDLRHTFASHYMMNGGNLYDLQHILGHSDSKVTQKYAHLSQDHIAQKKNLVSFDAMPLLKIVNG